MNKTFDLKGSSISLNTLFLYQTNLSEIETKFQNLVKQAPAMFSNTPIILDIRYLNENIPEGMLKIFRTLLKNYGMNLIGIRNASPLDIDQANQIDIPVLSQAPVTKSTATKKEITNNNKLHPNHLRSGQQLSNTHGDITIIGNVNPGAEVIAAGNITITGALRGKALAGIQGNKNACVYCHDCSAELISINGTHIITEELPHTFIGKPTLWKLKNNELTPKIIHTH